MFKTTVTFSPCAVVIICPSEKSVDNALGKEKANKILSKIATNFDKTILIAGNIEKYQDNDLDKLKFLSTPDDLIKHLGGID